MKAVVQRVKSASVEVENKVVAQIKKGYLVLLGCQKGDTANDKEYIVKKLTNLRIFEDEEGKMNLSIKDVSGDIIVVSQFTLLGKTRKGNRPSFTDAELPEIADKLYMDVVEDLRDNGIDTQTGVFGAHMEVNLLNDGPVTILLDSKDTRK